MLDGGVSVGDYWGCGGEDFFGVGLSGYLGVFEVGGFGPVVYCFGDGGYGCLCGVGLVWVCGVCGGGAFVGAEQACCGGGGDGCAKDA